MSFTWGDLFKEGLKIVGKNLLGGRDSDGGGGSSAGLSPDSVDFGDLMMTFEKPLKSGKVQGAPFKVSNYATNRKYWEQRMLEYLILAKAIK